MYMFRGDEITENDKYRNENYPNLHPCVDGCKYWRVTYTGTHCSSSSKCCHYNIDNDELRGDYPDLINGTCSKYEKGEGKGKRTQPFYKTREHG